MRAADAFLRRVGVPRERLFFAVVCAGALLLLSGLMLRQESQTPAARTFRDGFTVAEHTLRRVQDTTNATGDTTAGSATETTQMTQPVTPVVGADDAVGGRTTTIKTEGGDEITIKRAATTKGSTITTIQRHEDGKITIDTMAAEQQDTAGEEVAEVEEEEKEALGDYEKIDLESVASIQRKDAQQEVSDGKQEEEDEAVIVSGERKVTLVQVARALDDEPPAKKRQLVRAGAGVTR